jgi:hypothetical protein
VAQVVHYQGPACKPQFCGKKKKRLSVKQAQGVAYSRSIQTHPPISVMSLFFSCVSNRAIIISTAFLISRTRSSLAFLTASTFLSYKINSKENANFKNRSRNLNPITAIILKIS